MFGVQPTLLILILIIALVIFGQPHLPGLGKRLGQLITQFREAVTGLARPDSPE